ncbi:IS701 family transposase [Fodinisporobacter ferrooxydans]|uniref:IS701 family transposase n=1 Tax=Fodinisporobacter ferrooxydans TaxID=2901836 RepID=A0ABY4CGE1_9BACL|nr:IS701 family transposase [Alicyclobacillaceae bacterium MYW30-H2]UOF89074.1 IS701 family transposase [Alicyclobacillaceae bacterium MYW30-H2]UOF89266.1 IS701 family transposase [Alicyclobacillaceae bacterium MYW30-H2]UOF91956.1 IS701 family transposase [Alicyclobacillaceae bacterium MYW30-H2]UOF92110.1 IS701 family transposase [Alicyclobacillaceae bacterium MYW30-H2]
MVTLYSAIVKFILAMQLQFTAPQRNHLLHIMQGIILCEGRKTITQIRSSTNSYRHLSCMTKFLKHSPWCVNRMQKRRMQFLLEKIRRKHSKKGDTRSIVFLIIDDTSCKKDVSTKHIEALDFHFSHDEGKGVWSHCLVTAHLVSEGYSFAWDFRPYFREGYCNVNQIPFKSKNDLALELIQSYEASDDELVYVLMDSWYTSKKIIDACNAKGFHIIAAVKTNRKIRPAGIRIQIAEFATNYIHQSDLHSVTVGNQNMYWVYEYEGPLADVENVKVLLSWEKEFDSSKTPFCILCTDQTLDLETILRYYQVRWNIETGYRYFKEMLGFDQYQLQSFYAIQRYWAIQFLVYNFLELQRNEWSTEQDPMTLGDVVRRIRKEYFGQIVTYVYQQALAQRPLFEVLDELKLSA